MIKEKRLILPSDGLQVGGCNEGDKWLQCSNQKCNQLIIGGQCQYSPGMCTMGESAAVSIECINAGTFLAQFRLNCPTLQMITA